MATFAFNEIPDGILVPGVYAEIDDSRAAAGAFTLPQRVIVIGSRLPTGTVAANVARQILGDRDGQTFFGEDSQLAHALEVTRNYSAAGRLLEVWAIGLDDDGGGVAATGTITFGGLATAAGTLDFRVAGRRIRVPVAVGDDGTAVATAAAAESYDGTPVTAGSALAVLTLTARHAAEFGNDIDIRVDSVPPGVTAVIAPMAGGATNPDVTATITAIGGQQYTAVISCYSDDANVTLLEQEMERREGPLVDQTGMLFVGFDGDVAAAVVYGSARNSRRSQVAHLALTPSPPWEVAAFAGMTDEVVNSTAPGPSRPRNRQGGTVRPRSGADIKGIAPPNGEDLLLREDFQLLLDNGITPLEVLESGAIGVVRGITTFQTDDLGNDSATYFDITVPRTLDAIRAYTKVRLQTLHPNKKLAEDSDVEVPLVVTPSRLRSDILTLHDDTLVPLGLIQAAFRGQFSGQLVVEIDDLDPNRVNIQMHPTIVRGLHVIAVQIQFV